MRLFAIAAHKKLHSYVYGSSKTMAQIEDAKGPMFEPKKHLHQRRPSSVSKRVVMVWRGQSMNVIIMSRIRSEATESLRI